MYMYIMYIMIVHPDTCKCTFLQVYDLAFSMDGNSFITVSNRKIRFWYIDTTGKSAKVGNRVGITASCMPSVCSLQTSSPQLLTGRSAVLGDLHNNCFVAVSCGSGGLTYAITRSGLLCQFNAKRQLVKYTAVKGGEGFSLVVAEGVVMCGCEDGLVRMFDPLTLDYVATLPKPHPLKVELLAAVNTRSVVFRSGGRIWGSIQCML